MSPIVGWILAALALAAGWRAYGWQGLVAGATLIVFWLVLQFNRSVRVMRNAGAAPIGRIDSAVMLNARLRAGMQMLQVLALTKSLGRRVAPGADVYAWADEGLGEVVVSFDHGRCKRWALNRPARVRRIELSVCRAAAHAARAAADERNPPCRWPTVMERSGWMARWWNGATPRSTC